MSCSGKVEKIRSESMEFSVLMSVYKNENAAYLNTALGSVVNQTLKPAEIVLVKDGLLTKELDECIESYMQQHPGLIQVLKYTENRGLGLALRDGITACRYEYIARMDSDDISQADRFFKQMQYLKAHPEIALLGTWITEFSHDENKPETKTVLPCTHDEILRFAKRRNPFRHMTIVCKKSAVLDSGNYRDFLWFEDYDLWIRIMQKGYKTANIPESLVNVRANETLFARRGGWKYVKQCYKFQKNLLQTRFITRIDFIINMLMRTLIGLIPNAMRVCFYKTFLRRNLSR